MKVPDILDNQQKQEQSIKKLSTSVVDNFMAVEKLSSYSFTTSKLNPKYYDRYKFWIQKKYNANMGWMERNPEIRKSILQKFPWAKSVIVIADNYYFEKERTKNTLKISRYAWGTDYHIIIEKKLKRILEKMKQWDKSINGRVYVDTGPILEKAYAVESGLGWMGKNSLIIVPGVGSYIFLGLIILNVEIDYKPQQIEPKCGKCTNCLSSCPTGALEKPYMLNANKCISYFSIEKKEDFTREEANWLQDWLYGCDICLDVCPWNKKWAKTADDVSYYDRITLLERTPKEWKDLTAEEFGQLFKKNVFKRLKFDRFRRNLLTNIKNSK